MSEETIVLGGGCFWCTEAVFLMLKGIKSALPGYAGPHTGSIPTYEQVSMGETPYVETVEIVYDPDQLSFEEILHVYFTSHDPTTLNQQGADIGTQYASVIFYTTERQREKAEHYIKVLSGGAYSKPMVTTVLPLNTFYEAEDYHKNYFERNKSAGYCQLVVAPKIEKIEEKFKHLLK